MAGIVVQVEDHLPDLLLAEKVLPYRHRGYPGRRFFRQSRSARSDAPEQEGFLQLGNGTHILEIQRYRIQAFGIRSLAVQFVAVTELAVLDVDFAAFGDQKTYFRRFQSKICS